MLLLYGRPHNVIAAIHDKLKKGEIIKENACAHNLDGETEDVATAKHQEQRSSPEHAESSGDMATSSNAMESDVDMLEKAAPADRRERKHEEEEPEANSMKVIIDGAQVEVNAILILVIIFVIILIVIIFNVISYNKLL